MKDNPFDFTEYVEKQNEDNEIVLCLFLEKAGENKIIYNQTPVNTLMEKMEKMKKGFCRMVISIWAMKERSIIIDFLKIAMK